MLKQNNSYNRLLESNNKAFKKAELISLEIKEEVEYKLYNDWLILF